ncbi:MAG: fumarylacetoacetate hydrolase family protein [Oscillospiraceae bacterium]|nr:fumarylacetoacetate hydrolase family protein [Oscillospiraceae bacterium]
MKFSNILVDGVCHLAADNGSGLKDLTAAGFPLTMDEVIEQNAVAEASRYLADSLPVVENPQFANVVNRAGKIVCVGLNYRQHAQNAHMKTYDAPALFSKYSDALVPDGTDVELPPWEATYDYEAELVIVIGKKAWGISEEEAENYIFGYTCGNDFSCRDPQMRSGQWLIGKTMPGFGPCGPCIVTADGYHPKEGKKIRSYVNGELRQDGTTADMIFSCTEIVSYASKYISLNPGDLIFTGTPSGVALEGGKTWLKKGDIVEVEVEGIGRVRNRMI